MKRHLNTLFVTTEGSYLSRERETIVVRRDEEKVLQVPALALDGVVFMCRAALSTPLLKLCAEKDLSLSVFSPTGRFIGKFSGPTAGNVLLRRAQYRIADDPSRRLSIARSFVIGKLANSRTVLRRAARDHGDPTGTIEDSVAILTRCLRAAGSAETLDRLRGVEGESARAYFTCFNDLVTVSDESFRMEGRSRRPPLNPINAMLSFAYSLLTHDVRSACEGVGLDPQVGFLHEDRPGRVSLALDLVEELRAPIADRAVLSIINRGQVSAKQFETDPGGAVQMNADARRTLIVTYQKKKQSQLLHPYLKEETSLGLIPHIQARLLSKTLRGDLDEYPPYFLK